MEGWLFLHHSVKWIGQAGFSAEKLKNLEIPVPPIEEQKRIIKKLEEILVKIEEARKLQEEQLQELELLKQSVLHQAFEGKL